MQADWEVEIGGDAPVIEANWSGFIDLRKYPDRAATLVEASMFPELGAALSRLNRPSSAVWTAKCDLWNLDSFDPDELDAPHQKVLKAVACYVDLLPGQAGFWGELERTVRWCRSQCARVQRAALDCGRVDLIVRRAVIGPETNGLGVTCYLVACGPTVREAELRLALVLGVFADDIAPPETLLLQP
jgi:hypothetical protein